MVCPPSNTCVGHIFFHVALDLASPWLRSEPIMLDFSGRFLPRYPQRPRYANSNKTSCFLIKFPSKSIIFGMAEYILFCIITIRSYSSPRNSASICFRTGFNMPLIWLQSAVGAASICHWRGFNLLLTRRQFASDPASI